MFDVKIADNLRERHRRIRGALVVQGTSFDAWCRREGITRQNADKALLGQWKGPTGRLRHDSSGPGYAGSAATQTYVGPLPWTLLRVPGTVYGVDHAVPVQCWTRLVPINQTSFAFVPHTPL